jgi:hypothetical protein
MMLDWRPEVRTTLSLLRGFAGFIPLVAWHVECVHMLTPHIVNILGQLKVESDVLLILGE